jgi:hypothetical protein
MRKEQDIFRYSSLEGLTSNVTVSSDRKVITLSLSAEDTSNWNSINVIYNASSEDYEFSLNGNEFKVGYEYNIYSKDGYTATSCYVPAHSFSIVYQ